jgi:acylphosphatase
MVGNMPEEILTQYQIIVSGKVQRVGFRDKVEDFAIENNVLGYVQNLRGQDVQIVAEGEKTNLIRFCKAVENCELPVKVRKITILEKPFEGKYEFFLINRGDPIEELGERFDHAIFFLHSIDTKQDRMLYKQDEMLEKQDQMLGKQDQMIEAQKHTVDLQSKTLSEIHSLRNDFADRFMQEVTKARKEIRELRSELVQAGVLCDGSR